MKILRTIGLILVIAVFCLVGTCQEVSAKEYTTEIENMVIVQESKNQLLSENNMEIKEMQGRGYNLWFSGKQQELEVGESMVIGTTDEGGVVSITCVSSSTELTKGSMKTTTKRYNITHTTTLGKEKVVLIVDLECKWFLDGLNGYIDEFNGVCTVVDGQWSYEWDEDSEVVGQYDWAMWLDMKYLGSTYSRMFGAHYNALNSTLTINTRA